MNMEQEIDVAVQLELADYLRATYWVLLRKLWPFLLILMLGGFVFPILFLVGVTGEAAEPSGSNWAFFVGPIVVLLIVGSPYFQAKRNMASQPVLQEELRYHFRLGGLRIVSPSSTWETTWSNIVKAQETGSNFLLFVSNSEVHIVPKRCFETLELVIDIRRLLGEALESRAKLWGDA